MDFFIGMAEGYDAWMTETPTQAKVVTAVTCNVASDLIAQSISRSRTDPELRTWDILPPIRLAIWGILCTPVVDQWLEFLDSTFGVESDMLTLAKKLSIDQLFFGPLLFSSFLIFVGYFDSVTSNHKFADTFVNFFANVLQGHLAGMSYWLPITIAMFTVVPPKFRLLLLAVAGVIYNIWLSLWVSSKAGERGEGDKDKAKLTPRKKSAKAD